MLLCISAFMVFGSCCVSQTITEVKFSSQRTKSLTPVCVTATRVIPSVQLLYICHNIIVHEEAMLSPN